MEDNIKVEEVDAHHQFSREAVLYQSAETGQLDFTLSYHDITKRMWFAEGAAKAILKNSPEQTLQEVLPGYDVTNAQLDELIQFFNFDADPPATASLPRTMEDSAHRQDHLRNTLRLSVPEVYGESLPHSNASHFVMRSFLSDTSRWRKMMGLKLDSSGAPEGRSLIGLISGAMSIGALEEANSVERKLQVTDEVVSKVAQRVDVLAEQDEAQGEALQNIRDEQILLQKQVKESELSRHWAHTRTIVKAAADVAHEASMGKLSPAIRLLCDVPKIFQRFNTQVKKDGYTLPFNSSLFLHNLKASFKGNQVQLMIAVTVPLVRPNEMRWSLLRHIQRPVVYQERILDITEPNGKTLLAIDTTTGAALQLEEDAIFDCVHFPGVYYCTHGPTMIYHDSVPNTCLRAIYLGHFSDMVTFCIVHLRSVSDLVWAVHPNRFIIITAQPIEATLNCEQEAPSRVTLSKTVQQVTLREGCRLVTHSMSLAAAATSVTERLSCAIDVSSIDEHLQDLLGDIQLQDIKLPAPLHLSNIGDEVRRLRTVRQGWFNFSPRQMFILAIALGALLLVGIAFLYVYCRIKFLKVTPWTFVQGLLQQHGGGLPTEDHNQRVVVEVAPTPRTVPGSSTPTGSQSIAAVRTSTSWRDVYQSAFSAPDVGGSQEQPRRRTPRQVILPPARRDYVGGYSDDDSDGDKSWKRCSYNRDGDRLHTPKIEESEADYKACEVKPKLEVKTQFSDISEDEAGDDVLHLYNPADFDAFINSTFLDSPATQRQVVPAREPPTPPGSRQDRLAMHGLDIVPPTIEDGARFVAFIGGRTSRIVVNEANIVSTMPYSYALTLGQKDSLDFCASPSQLTQGDFGGVRLWLCLTGHQILLNVSLSPVVLPEADLMLGGRDAERLRISYQPAAVPREIPTPPEPMDTSEETIFNLLENDPLALGRLQQAADELMQETEVVGIVERVMTKTPPQPHTSPQAPAAFLERGQASPTGSEQDPRSMQSVVVLPIRKKPEGGIRKAKHKKKKLRKNQKNSVRSPSWEASCNYSF